MRSLNDMLAAAHALLFLTLWTVRKERVHAARAQSSGDDNSAHDTGIQLHDALKTLNTNRTVNNIMTIGSAVNVKALTPVLFWLPAQHDHHTEGVPAV